MTKEQEELYRLFDEELSCNFHMLVTRMNEFFKSNVCIPKGENRHKRADVLHEWAEDTTKELQVLASMDGWKQSIFCTTNEYRIKPSEPIYEYKWRVGCMFGIDTVTEQFLTEEEVGKKPFRKIEETKRVRV